MKQYRILYEALFLPRPLKGFEYKGKQIEALALYFLYRYFDSKTGKEIFFKQGEQPVREFNCSIDKEHLYQMTPLHRTDCNANGIKGKEKITTQYEIDKNHYMMLDKVGTIVYGAETVKQLKSMERE